MPILIMKNMANNTVYILQELHTFPFTRIPNKCLSHLPLSINSLHSHLHLSLFQRCLLLQTITFNLLLHLQVSCQDTYLFSLVFEFD